jgi:hypothetical protein
MAEPLAEQVIRNIDEARGLYHRLVLVVAPAGAGKTAALRDVQQRLGALLLNVNLELSLRMLELTERQRVLQLPRIFAELVGEAGADVVLLDNIEILFDVSLKQDPLRLLQANCRNKTLVVAWNGVIEHGRLTYAVPSHPEFCECSAEGLLVVTPESIEEGSNR